MSKGPKGEKYPADVIGNAVHVMRIATGEIEDTQTSMAARTRIQRRLARWAEKRARRQ